MKKNNLAIQGIIAILTLSSAVSYAQKQAKVASTPVPTPTATSTATASPADTQAATQAETAEGAKASSEQTSNVSEEKTSSSKPTTDGTSSSRQWKLGPTFTISIPRISEYALEYISGSEMFSAGIGFGGFESKLNSETKLSFKNYEIKGRWHPFFGSFFLGLGYGKQSIKAEAVDTISSVSVKLNYSIDSSYMFPHLGWFGVWDSGFTLGFDFGTIIPSGVSASLTSNAPTALQSNSDYVDLKTTMEDGGEKLGKATIPYLGVIKLGWLF